jgi:hypothetical protein
MIGTVTAAVIVLVNLVLAGVLGIGAGGLTCFVLRRRWSVKTAFVDGGFAFVVAFISAHVLSTILARLGIWWTSVVRPVLAIAAASVVARHLVLLALSRRGTSRTSQ